MTANKATVQRYMDGFNKLDHAQILSCVANDVVWDMPGFYHLVGKEAFGKEIQNPAFVGRPIVRVSRLTEQDDVVVAEGTVQAKRTNGEVLNAVFCDVFAMHSAKIKHLTSYLMEVKQELPGWR